MLERAHIVQPVGEFDEHDAHVAHHGQQHLADIFRLPVFTVRELNLVDLGYAFDDVRDLLAELRRDVLGGDRRIFDRIVKQARGDGGRVQLHLGQDLGYFKGMQNVRLPGSPELPAVVLHAKLPRFANDADVIARPILADGRKQLGKLRRQDARFRGRFEWRRVHSRHT